MPEWFFASLRNNLHLAFLDKTRTAKRSAYRLFQPVDNDRHLREDQVHHVPNTKRVSWKYLPTGLGMAKS
ncbi:hypothetical protein GX48_07424 [Paracoccidioides brasiliensis]|nr:hypothetical protein GX48_07424 [Paracoccidioides brasiliensis]